MAASSVTLVANTYVTLSSLSVRLFMPQCEGLAQGLAQMICRTNVCSTELS